MITTPKFNFIHMHKTGGQSLINIMGQNIKGAEMVGYHYPIELVPESKKDLPVVGIVRNPWDWYISWYAFNTRPNVSNPLFFIISDGFQASYQKTLKNLINLCDDSFASQNYRKALIDIFPDSMGGNNGIGLTKDSIRQMEGSSLGYYSWQFQRMHGTDMDSLHIGRFENLQNDFIDIMDELDVDETETLKAAFDKSPRLNASRHSHYSAYLDNELKDLIALKEADLIESFGYQFDQQTSDNKAIEFPPIQIGRVPDGFQKLSGKASNYLLLKPSVDLEFIKRKLAKIPERFWHQSGRENTYEVHKQTQALRLIHDADFRHYNPTTHDLYKDFRKELKPVLDFITETFHNNGYFARILFARLSGKGQIATHTDGLYSLLKCHRIHIPVITNDEVVFTIGGEEKVLKEGEMWEINNATLHAVDNRSNLDRIHLIIDWVPNCTVRQEDKKPPAPQPAVKAIPKPGYNGKQVGRNEPCPCNSGKKFKQCHGAIR